LGNRDSERLGKFYWEQVAEITRLLETYVKQSNSIDIDKYLRICEELGQEPDPDKMPLEISDFPLDVQVAFFIFGFLEDVWEGMSGIYLGKNWRNIEYLFNLYKVEEPKTVLYIMKLYEGILVGERAKKAEQKRKAEKRKSAGGGKSFTHNVQG
jgi:hypothetical protein